MAGAQLTAELGRWSADGLHLTIEYSLAVMDQIRAEAVTGFCRFPRGGIEIGGVLFGKVEGDVVRILAARAVPCQYATGPSYVLSEKDEAELRRVLGAAATDPALSGLESLGWYHSHNRSEVFLSPQDLEIHDRYFPDPRQVALVVRPEPFGTARAGFFVRERDGSIRTEASYKEFVIRSAGSKARQGPPQPAAAAAPEVQEEPAAAPPPPEPVREMRPEPPRPPAGRPREPIKAGPFFFEEETPRRRRAPRWIWAALVLVLAGAGGLLVPRLYEPSVPQQPLSLRVLDVDGQLQITWNRTVPAVLTARDAALEIVDGSDRVNVPFDTGRLRQGSITYTRHSDTVDVRLMVRSPAGPQEEFVRFLGRSAPPAAAALPALPLSEIPQPQAQEPAPAPAPVAAPAPETPAPESRSTASTAPREPAPAAEPKRLLRPFDASRLRSFEKPAQNATVPMPPAEPAPRTAFSLQQNVPRLPAAEDVRTAPPPPVAAPVPAPETRPKPLYSGPTSGRIIWTGDFARGGTAWLDGRRTSVGFATSELPGVPVRVTIYPAELSGRGLTVYSATGAPRRESPGAQNGWNNTLYMPDPRRAGEVLMLESPGPQNGWKRLSLRNDARDLSLIIIDWRLADSSASR